MDPLTLTVLGLLGAIVATALVTLVWQLRNLATRQELHEVKTSLDHDIKASRRETDQDIRDVHERLDDVIKPLGEIRGELTGIKDQLTQLNNRLP